MNGFLKTVELFRDLSDAEIEKLVPFLKLETFKRGEAIFRERDPGGKIYFVDCGVVEITKLGRGEGRPTRVTLLERGEILGELSLADEGPRTVSAVASVTPETKVYSIEVPALQSLLAQNPDMSARVQRNLLRRLSIRLRAATDAITCILHAMESKA